MVRRQEHGLALSRRDGAVVLVVCGLIGWGIGLWRAEWQWAIEHAQWIAGLAAPIEGSLGWALHSRLWSLVAQMASVPLRLGVSEWCVSLVVSGLAGMVTCQALGMFTFAATRRVLPSILIVVALPWLNDVATGAAYPVVLMGSAHSYGAFGLAVPVLALGLLGAGWSKSGGVLLGLAPAVHLPLGVLAWMLALAGRPERRPWGAFTAGLMLTALSAVTHAFVSPPGANASAEALRITRAFAESWDGHRAPVDPASGALLLMLVTTAIGWWMRPREFVGRVALASGVVGLAGACSTWLPAATVPYVVLMAMPGRLMNVALFIWPALLAGLPARLLPATAFSVSRRRLAVASAAAFVGVTAAGVTSTRLDAPLSTPVWVAISAHGGPIVTAGSLWSVQARTRRVVLLDGGTLDALVYVPEAALFTKQILREVYGLPLEPPPDSALRGGVIPDRAHRRVWESRTLHEWMTLRSRFGITGVLTYADWTLDLPAAAADANYRFYFIPEA